MRFLRTFPPILKNTETSKYSTDGTTTAVFSSLIPNCMRGAKKHGNDIKVKQQNFEDKTK
nr:hypothetical protein [Candidatus Baldrarchaeota archaeon]